MSTKVQMLARWAEMSLRKNNINKEEADLKRLISGEEDQQVNLIVPEVTYEYGPIVFDMKHVKRYNRAKEAGHTTVHFKDGDSLVLKVPFLEFMEVDLELTGKTILDYTPIDYIDEEAQDMDIDEDEDDLEL